MRALAVVSIGLASSSRGHRLQDLRNNSFQEYEGEDKADDIVLDSRSLVDLKLSQGSGRIAVLNELEDLAKLFLAFNAVIPRHVPSARRLHCSTMRSAGSRSDRGSRSTNSFLDVLKSSSMAMLTAVSLLTCHQIPVYAENELTTLAQSKSTSELVDPKCFVHNCQQETVACGENMDCTKGLLCTAKCLGDTQCAMGCFAQYGNKDLDNMMQCTIEKEKCIKIGIMEPGADGPLDAPKPPKPLVAVRPSDMDGKWYKVLGWNSNYDCFDCQRNSFSKREVSREVSAAESAFSAAMEVEFSLARHRIGQPPEMYRPSLMETLHFDRTPGSHRTAHTEGKMFGITFWENWYVIGKEKETEPPFRFVYYTGKTVQNRYAGAFVYARQPELPREALPHIYQIAREAGMEPTGMCCIDNACFKSMDEAVDKDGDPAVSELVAPTTGTDSDAVSGNSRTRASNSEEWRKLFIDVSEYLEDPRPHGEALVSKQRKMSEVREYDWNGHSALDSFEAKATLE